jgi:hypothetical protein
MYELMSSNGTKERKKEKQNYRKLKKNSNVHGPFRVVKIEEIE